MNSDISIRPVSTPTYREPAMPVAARTTAPTQVPESQSVVPVASGESARNEPRSAMKDTQQRAEEVTRKVVFDRAAAEMVYRVVDPKTNRVILQIPEERVLKARAYQRAVEDGLSETAASVMVNRQA